MLKYARLLNEVTGLCEVGLGTNVEFYKSIDMTELDVTQSNIDNEWYLTSMCPNKPEEQILLEEKQKLLKICSDKAKEAVEGGYVVFKNAEFETNAQTVGDLTATMLLMQASSIETYLWLSKDDKAVELTLEDFGTLGGLIASFKNTIWQEKYIAYKIQIEQATSLEELNNIIIEYQF